MSLQYDVQFINPFLRSVVEVLSTMAMVKATPGNPFVNTKRTCIGDVTGLIGITGYARGTMSLSMEAGAILHIVSNMLGEECTEITDDIADATGELTNMIAGQARQTLATQGMTFQASTPTVVVGKGHCVKHINASAILAIPFKTDQGNLVIELSFTRFERPAQPEKTKQKRVKGVSAIGPDSEEDIDLTELFDM